VGPLGLILFLFAVFPSRVGQLLARVRSDAVGERLALRAAADSSNLNCQVLWMEEDSNTGTFRGQSATKSLTDTGRRQMLWSSLNDYVVTPSTNTYSLSTGGEGSINLYCRLNQTDQITQYYIEEDMY
jgi:hypothetical protein